MFRKLLVSTSLLALSACASAGGSGISYEKTGEVPGTAGLEVAAKKCAPLEGSSQWQACVAHYDGLYTKSNGTIKRSYTLSADAPRPTGKIEQCTVKVTWNSVTQSWFYSGCETSR